MRGVSAKRRRQPVYRELADRLRESIRESGGQHERLPTEAELSKKYKTSRQTVRRAYQELVADGLVRRTPRRGTFPIARRPYVRSFGTIEDLIALREDTELEVVEPLTFASSATPDRTLAVGPTAELTIRRLYKERPFVCAVISFPAELGRRLERSALSRRGARNRKTVLEMLEDATGVRIAVARQVITIDVVPRRLARLIDVSTGTSVLRIDRTYYDEKGSIVQLTTSYFNPSRYSYALELRR